MTAASLIEKGLDICKILTGRIALLKFSAQGNIEQHVIQFLALLCIMDKSGRFCTDSDVQQCLKYPVKPCHYKFQMPITIHFQIHFHIMNGAKCSINIISITSLSMGKRY